MKHFSWLIMGVFFLYICLAGMCAYAFTNYEKDMDKQYVVDINRIMHQLQNETSLNHVDITQYPDIEEVIFLDEFDHTTEEREDFYRVSTHAILQPWYVHGVKKGMLKFIYVDSMRNLQTLYTYIQYALFCIMLCVCSLLFCIKRYIIKPFFKLSNMPYELAQGHLKEIVKVEKTSYLRNFLWGMSLLQDRLQTSKHRQFELEKEKKQLLLSISHDIKTPLNMIKLYAQGQREGIYHSQEEQTHAMLQIDEKCSIIENYVNEIMKYSREDILHIDVKISEFYVKELLDKVLHVYREQCELRHIILQVEPYENRILKGDIDRSQEVLENLFENAFKYGDGRRIHISLYEEESYQLMRFFNTGIPVQEQECLYLFDSFYRGSNAQRSSGYGLGLYICKNIMRKMEGDIFLEACEEGMSFVLVFR